MEAPMYLTKNSHGVYYYRRPITAEDQQFWRGPTGGPKREWNKSLRTKDRREAILRLAEASDLYEAERAQQYARHASEQSPAVAEETPREREEREAKEAIEAARQARYVDRAPLRTLWRQRRQMSTAELSAEEAAVRDLLREEEADKADLERKVAYMEARIRELGGVPSTEVHGALPAGSGGPTVDDLISAYEADKAPGWSGSSKKAVMPVFRVLRDVFPDKVLADITRQDARGVVKLLERLPTQIGKRKELAGLSVPDAVEKGRKLGLRTISPKTINDGYLLHIASMFNWAVREQWLASTPFSGLSVYDPVDDAERRDPFTIEQLNTLFSAAPWKGPWEKGGDRPGGYWVPLLCLFHGLRNGEAAGLRVEDIAEEDGIPVLHVRAYDDKRVKTAGSRGTLPIHPELLRIGFLRYVAERREAGEYLLFPEGTANARGQIAAKLAERFSRRVKRLGLVGRKLGMHSFRHNFEDRLRAAEVAERTALALSRRTESGSSGIYGTGLSAGQMLEALARVSYPGLQLNHLDDQGTVRN